MEPDTNPILQAYWQAFLDHGAPPDAAGANYQAWSFGASPEDADELGGLVLQGLKTATASLVWAYEGGVEDPYPELGGYSIILDGRGQPMCIIQTTRLYILPFDEVDAEQAYQEGEGDRSLAYWRDVHWRYFGWDCQNMGREPDLKMPVLCERFTLLYH